MRHRVVLGAAIAGLTAAPLALALDFGRSADVAVGRQPTAIAPLYVDDDDHTDLVTANAAAPGLSLLLGNGDGTFRPRIDISDAGPARGITVADFNSDGLDDVAVANVTGNSVSLLLGNGATLVPGGRFPVGASPQAVVSDDLDSDGNQDLVTANGAPPDKGVSVLLGLGDGTFTEPDVYGTRTRAQSVAVTDMDVDGIVDLVSTDSSANTVSFLIGTGEGTFEDAVTSRPIGARPWAVTPGGSGVYVAALGGSGGAGGGIYFVTYGDDPPSRIEVGKSPGSVLVDDLDLDGRDDVLAALPLSREVVVKTGEGTLLRRRVGAAPSMAVLADLNEDGAADIAVANRGSASVSVLLNGVAATPGRPSCVVPRLLGRTVPAARPILTASRCTVGRVTRRWARARRGRIVAQRPQAGTRLPTGASVALTVSRGPRR
ncbi:MAG TPA: FG-GAP-like repeat-containing protein [Gaiellaceae bacterium]|nr:FG-GAP-like repeat-containing protein [Gaiellaceae bacterium]